MQLTRAQRDAVFEEIAFAFECAASLPLMLEHGSHSLADRVDARELIWQLRVALRLLEQLGWQDKGNRDGYVLEVDEEVDQFAAGIERYALVALRDNSEGLVAHSDEVSAKVRRLIDADLDALGAARAVRDAFEFARAGVRLERGP